MAHNRPADNRETLALRLANRVNRIAISPTATVLTEAERLRAQGVDLADFGPGEPDFPTPEHIKRAAVEALAANRTKYTAVAGLAPCVKQSVPGTAGNSAAITSPRNASLP